VTRGAGGWPSRPICPAFPCGRDDGVSRSEHGGATRHHGQEGEKDIIRSGPRSQPPAALWGEAVALATTTGTPGHWGELKVTPGREVRGERPRTDLRLLLPTRSEAPAGKTKGNLRFTSVNHRWPNTPGLRERVFRCTRGGGSVEPYMAERAQKNYTTVPSRESSLGTYPGRAMARPGSTPRSRAASLPRPGAPVLPSLWKELS
jgi:hypothetical protein